MRFFPLAAMCAALVSTAAALMLPAGAGAATSGTAAQRAAITAAFGLTSGGDCQVKHTIRISHGTYVLVRSDVDPNSDCQSASSFGRKVKGKWKRTFTGSDGSWADQVLACKVIIDLEPGRACDDKVYLSNYIGVGDEYLEVKPKFIAMGAAHGIDGIVWSKWGVAVATATGTCKFGDVRPVALTASKIKRINGKKRYTSFASRYTTAPNKGAACGM